MAPRTTKGKRNIKGKITKRRKDDDTLVKRLGEAGVGAYMRENLGEDEGLGKVVLIEPRGWLDFACVGITTLKGEHHAVYDLNLLEHIYAMMFAYERFHVSPATNFVGSIRKTITEDDEVTACEWVSYNTVRGAEYLKHNQPLFVRSRHPVELQMDWHNA